MSDLDFETRFASLAREYAHAGVPPIDAFAVAEETIATGRRVRIRWPFVRGRGRPVPVLLGLLLLLILAGAMVVVGSRLLAPPIVPTPTGHIAFVRDGFDPDASTDVWVMNADGSNRTRLTHSAGPEDRPVWSPDATRIAYTVGDSAAQIAVMNADGSNQHLLTHTDFPAGRPTWSPDGKLLAFSDASRGELYVVSADGTGLTRITQPSGGGDVDPAWSPQGDRIAFANGDSIYTVRPDGSARTLFAQHLHPSLPSPEATATDAYGVTRIVSSLAWSPDGTRIAATIGDADGNGPSSIWLEDGRSELNLTAGLGLDAVSPTWSPDGRWLAFVSFGSSSSYGDIYIIRADGSNLRAVLPGPSRDSAPAWSWR